VRRLILVLGILALAWSTPAFAQETAAAVPIIIDTDFAGDDWMAILYLLQHPSADVQAITLTGTGEAHCDPGVQNALNLLALAGQPDIPVACGRETPLEGDHTFPEEWRTSVDRMFDIPMPVSEAEPFAGDAVTLLQSSIAASAQPPVIITLGPLTNIAELFAADPAVTSQIARVVIMGGAVSVPGNVWLGDGSAEWNVYVDPLAADQVIQSGAPVTLVPLDATNHVPLTRDVLNGLRDDRTTPAADFVYQVLAAQSGFIQSGGYYFWDPLAAALAIDRGLGAFQGRPVRVATGEGEDSGRTVADGRGTPVEVAVSADRERFELAFHNVLNGRPAGAPLPEADASAAPVGDATALVRRYFEEGWAVANSPVLDEVVDPAYALYGSDPSFVNDINGLRGTIATAHTLMPDLSISVEFARQADDMVFARVLLQGTLSNAELGSLATGAPAILTIHSMLRVAEGRIVEEWQVIDLSPLLFGINAINMDVMEQFWAATSPGD